MKIEISDEELACIIEELDFMPMSQAATRPQAVQICKELLARRQADRLVSSQLIELAGAIERDPNIKPDDYCTINILKERAKDLL